MKYDTDIDGFIGRAILVDNKFYEILRDNLKIRRGFILCYGDRILLDENIEFNFIYDGKGHKEQGVVFPLITSIIIFTKIK